MNVGTGSVGHDGMQELVTVSIPLPSVVDEMEGGQLGVCWYVEISAYTLDPVEEEY